jgi:UDP-N-acetylmuramyl pentapeptide phosphotransferase/UDP-N-acetylglucosamine-1-phosphate transferase
MMLLLERLCWAALALLHLLPASALFRPASIASLYTLAPNGPLFPLLHHRAALFVIVVAACLWALFDPGARRLASVVVAISMLSFLGVYWSAGSPPALKTIATADLAGLPFLAFAIWRSWAA